MNLQVNLKWESLPLCLLTPEQQIYLRNQAEIRQYKIGEVIWSTDKPGKQFLLISGNVRLREDGKAKSLATLTAGDWFGDLLELSGEFKAVASSKDVEVVCWNTGLWQELSSVEINRFWIALRSRYQPQDSNLPQPISGYPFILSPKTAAACLTMAAHYLQNPIQLELVQRQLRGEHPNDVMEAGEKLGLQLRQLQVTSKDLRQLSFPALLRWQNQDWIVVYGVRGNRVIIANPTNLSQTCESIPQALLAEHWNGQLWLVEQIQNQDKFNLTWFLPAIWQHRKLLAEVLLISFALQLLGLATPIITQFIIDRVMVYQNHSALHVMAIALFGVAILEAILGILRLFIFSHTANRLDLSLSAQLFRQLMRLPLNYFESRRVGDTVARAQELENIRQFLTGTALTVILDSIFSVVYLALMFSYSFTLTWVALAVIPLFALLTLVATPILRHWLNETFNRGADSQSFLVETVTGIHAVKAHAAERTSRRRWEGLFARYIRTSFKAATTSNIGSNIGDFLTNFSYLIILWFGAGLVMEQKLTIGALVAFQMLASRVTDPLLRLVQLWQEFQQVLLSVDRLGDILNVAPEAEPGSGLVLPPLRGQVSFEQVLFRYQPDQKEAVLKGINFTVQPGMFVGIVGRSGSGKSTLSKLLQRLYQPESGSIIIDDFDIKTADIGSLRQQISVVLQEDFLFNGSISENITLGNPDIATEQVITAARLAVAHDFICELPQGYETNIGERGIALSGGQRQRIALARLFLSQAPILILDEATSGLDSETEQKVLHNLQEVSGDRTVFMIAHRFAPLKQADLILVLEKGVIVEKGNHEELVQKRGVYWALYQRQLASV
ncbi:type I secretion system permease/ATPase [Nostoc sp. RF31YmG]|nr:type I secretion system permease/ATPase [Nostoc sp. RF31YmG]